MNSKIPGLHHVTAIASDPQRNLDFYVGLLGLRFVKRYRTFSLECTHACEFSPPGSPCRRKIV
jgi:glyoxalase family protein